MTVVVADSSPLNHLALIDPLGPRVQLPILQKAIVIRVASDPEPRDLVVLGSAACPATSKLFGIEGCGPARGAVGSGFSRELAQRLLRVAELLSPVFASRSSSRSHRATRSCWSGGKVANFAIAASSVRVVECSMPDVTRRPHSRRQTVREARTASAPQVMRDRSTLSPVLPAPVMPMFFRERVNGRFVQARSSGSRALSKGRVDCGRGCRGWCAACVKCT